MSILSENMAEGSQQSSGLLPPGPPARLTSRGKGEGGGRGGGE